MNEAEYDALYRSCPPGAAPGGILARVVAADGRLLVERPLRSFTDADMGDLDGETALEWAERSGAPVRLHTYDGDTGECLLTCVVNP